ncbi:MAG: nucleotide-binding universal stress UspA family protein [Gammaproteobacteria bacterium]|jgi:nucleotide-binding universal stress UspA family protein
MIRNILVHVDVSKRSQMRVECAVQLARSMDARVDGVFVFPPAPISAYLAGAGDGAAAAHVVQEAMREAQIHCDQRRSAFEAAVGTVGGAWFEADGPVVKMLCEHAYRYDLVVLGQHDYAIGEASLFSSTEGVVLESGRPVLIIPEVTARPSVATQVLIAWTPSREATRSVHDAMPLLRNAGSVVLVTFNADEARSSSGPAMVAHLGAHGVNATHRNLECDDDVGKALLSCAAEHESDLIVMGAYGHSRLRELVFGGATRDVLKNMDVPVLMSN